MPPVFLAARTRDACPPLVICQQQQRGPCFRQHQPRQQHNVGSQAAAAAALHACQPAERGSEAVGAGPTNRVDEPKERTKQKRRGGVKT